MNIKNSKTEKFLFGSLSVVLFVLALNLFTGQPLGLFSANASSEEGSSEKSTMSSNSEDEAFEESENSEESEESTYEMSEESQMSQGSGYGAQQGAAAAGGAGAAATTTTQAMSQESVKSQEMSQKGEMSEASEMSEVSEISEKSVASIEGYDEVVETQGNKARVRKQEKLLGIFSVYIDSEVTLDEAGEVIDEKKGLFNWLQDLFSF